jgi:hypothetical protein
MFALDASAAAVQSGLLAAAAAAVKAALAALADSPAHAGVTVGVVVYDTKLHFFDLAKGAAAPDDLPPMLVVPDVDDPFMPSPSCLMQLGAARATLERLLDGLPGLFAQSQVSPEAGPQGRPLRRAERSRVRCGLATHPQRPSQRGRRVRGRRRSAAPLCAGRLVRRRWARQSRARCMRSRPTAGASCASSARRRPSVLGRYVLRGTPGVGCRALHRRRPPSAMHAACCMQHDARHGTHHCCAAARARRFRAMTTPPRSVRTARRSCSHLTGPSTHRRVQPPAALAVSLPPLLAPADPTPARTRCCAPQGSQVFNHFVAAPQLAKECSAAQVSVDLHACTRVFSDLVSMGQVCRLTGGQLSYIPGFDGAPAALPPKQTTKTLEAKRTPPGDA